jgi:hypothetical protein
MWQMDPDLQKQLDNIREMVRISHQTPTREWPLVFVEECAALLVVREWPGGTITAYTMAKDADEVS